MSELKAHNINDLSLHDIANCDFYLKSEADKVIADLESQLQAANEQVENLINSASSIMLFQDKVNDNKCTELRHAKYKRCLAMAYAMDKLMFALELQGKSVEIGLRHTKAMNRKYKWLELAEKLKE